MTKNIFDFFEDHEISPLKSRYVEVTLPEMFWDQLDYFAQVRETDGAPSWNDKGRIELLLSEMLIKELMDVDSKIEAGE